MEDENRHIAFICSKGTLDMAYPALVMGWAALGNGIDVTLFFTFWGMDLINKATQDHLKFTAVGNTAMHLGKGSASIPQLAAGLPGMQAIATKMLKGKIAGLDIPEVPEFMELLHDMGATFWACKLSVDMAELTKDDLIDSVEDIINVTDFMELSEGAQIIFI
jgi:peroxiredoxin family protein